MADSKTRGVQTPALSEQPLEKQAEAAFSLEQRIMDLHHKAHAATWDLAESLYEFHEIGGWSLLGYDTLNDFLAQPGLGMKRRWFFQLTRMWRDLTVVRRIQPKTLRELEPSKVQEVVPAIMRGDVKTSTALSDVKTLGARDLRKKYGKPSENGKVEDERLDADTEPELVQCDACGSWVSPATLKAGPHEE